MRVQENGKWRFCVFNSMHFRVFYFQARLQYQNGSNQSENVFKISESVLFISKDVIPDVKTFVLTDPDIHHKHAAITCSDYGLYYLTDLGSETYIKIGKAFERLDPMVSIFSFKISQSKLTIISF